MHQVVECLRKQRWIRAHRTGRLPRKTAGGNDPTMKNPRAEVPATSEAMADADEDDAVAASVSPSAPLPAGPVRKGRHVAGDPPATASRVREAIGNWPDPM